MNIKDGKISKQMEDLKSVEIVKKADQLLDAVMKSSDILKGKPFTTQTLKEAKIVGSFANTVVNAMGKTLQVVRTEVTLSQIPERIKQIKALKKKGLYK